MAKLNIEAYIWFVFLIWTYYYVSYNYNKVCPSELVLLLHFFKLLKKNIVEFSSYIFWSLVSIWADLLISNFEIEIEIKVLTRSKSSFVLQINVFTSIQ